MNIKGHFETITRHKLLVMKYCFECGLYEQGLAHDLSKYSPTEFIPGCIYYQGDHSPNEAERAAKGYTSAWLHHKGRNKHHLEYWIDYSTTKTGLTGMKIPLRYVCEMVCDRVAASQIYLGDKYTDASAWEYYQRSKDHYLMHPETRALLEKLLRMDFVKDYPDDTELLEDVIIENKQAMEMTSIYNGILSGTMDTFASVISNNLNIVMKFLATVTIVMSIPTMIASFYGMNVRASGMPFAENPYGFGIVLFFTLLLTLIVAYIFNKKDLF